MYNLPTKDEKRNTAPPPFSNTPHIGERGTFSGGDTDDGDF